MWQNVRSASQTESVVWEYVCNISDENVEAYE